MVKTEKVAEANRALKNVNPGIGDQFVEIQRSSDLAAVAPAVAPTPILCLFKTALLRRFIFTTFFAAWTTGLLNFGYTFNLEFLKGSVFLNSGVLGLITALAPLLVLTFDRIFGGIKIKTIHAICSSFVLFLTLGIIILRIVGKVEILLRIFSFFASSFSQPFRVCLKLMTNEHFPTKLRAQADGLAHVFAYFGGLVAPFVLYLGKFWAPLPDFIFGFFTAINIGLVRKFLFETRGKKLPEESDLESEATIQKWLKERPEITINGDMTLSPVQKGAISVKKGKSNE